MGGADRCYQFCFKNIEESHYGVAEPIRVEGRLNELLVGCCEKGAGFAAAFCLAFDWSGPKCMTPRQT